MKLRLRPAVLMAVTATGFVRERVMKPMLRWGLGSCAAILLGSWLAAAGETEPPHQGPASETSSQAAFFEKRIRPVMVAQCYGCHATGEGRQVKGGLALDSRAGLLQGGDSGPVVVPGKPEESLLITALSHTDPALAMPPKKRLPETVLADFSEWVRNGAVDPREREGVESIRSREAATPHWSFQPPRNVSTPTVKGENWQIGRAHV